MLKLCDCGCGKEVTSEKSRFLWGHGNRGKKDIYIKRAKNYKEKHGVEYPMQLKEVKEKTKITWIKHFGTNHPNQTDQIKEKIKKTCIEKYGKEYPMQSKEVQEIHKQTCLENCGYDNWAKTSQGRKLARINGIRMIENQKLNGEPLTPYIGDNERLFLNELQQFTTYNILRNDHSFRYMIGRFPDGHIPEVKLFIQYDEHWHTNKKENDIQCTKDLESIPGYRVFRVSEKQWNENKKQVINEFKTIINMKEIISC